MSFSDVSAVAAALQKQATRDFGPVWQVSATVSAFAALESVPVDYWPVIIRDNIDQPGAAGYHTDDNGQPFSLVQADDQWQLTASHETLEMLADPFGNRTIAGSPPPQAPRPISTLRRVIYLVEVCDPCEDAQFAYGVNGQQLSDFITPHYYDPNGATGTLYSFRGNVKGPHTVLESGYVSFGNPVTNEWYQILVTNGQAQVRDLGKAEPERQKLARNHRRSGARRRQDTAPRREAACRQSCLRGRPIVEIERRPSQSAAGIYRDGFEFGGKRRAFGRCRRPGPNCAGLTPRKASSLQLSSVHIRRPYVPIDRLP